tara:strand:+ start:138 stop:293 length:156 start_codon:yes stop_codon:yes gene_type:complete
MPLNLEYIVDRVTAQQRCVAEGELSGEYVFRDGAFDKTLNCLPHASSTVLW